MTSLIGWQRALFSLANVRFRKYVPYRFGVPCYIIQPNWVQGATMSLTLGRTLLRCGSLTAALLILAGMTNVNAQTNMGTITGLVTDRSLAVLPGVTVTAKNVATGAEATTVTSSTGNYLIPNLPVGTYQISVSQTGFKTWDRSGIALSAGDNLRVDVTLDVGQVNEKVEVTAEAAQLKTESTEVSTTMEQKLVDQVPLPIAGIGGGMRNAFSIMMMLPQVKSGNGESAWDDFQVGGGQQHDWNVSADGQIG